jgi:integrase
MARRRERADLPKLTKTFIDNVKPPARDYDVHWDDAVKGYGLRVTAAGPGKPPRKVFFVMGRVAGQGKSIQFTIGPFGVYTEDKARRRARSLLQDMREGIDPRDAKRADEAMKVTLGEVMESYISRPGRLKASSAAAMKHHVDRAFAAWRDKPIANISEDDVRRRYREMAAKGLTGRPAPGQANISMATLRALINYAGRQYKRSDGSPLIAHNPVSALRDDWVELKPRTRDIATNKVGEVWHMLASGRGDLIAAQNREDGRINPQDADKQAGVDLIMFLLLTGARRNEAALLEWRNVNLDEGWWHIPDPKNANPVWLPLSSQAMALLAARPRIDGNPCVFASRSKSGHVMDTRAPLERISELTGGTLSAHDLRRTFVSIGVAACGIDLHKIELLTNHVPKGVTARHYLQTQRLQYLAPQAQQIGDWIGQQAAIAAAANVIALPMAQVA